MLLYLAHEGHSHGLAPETSPCSWRPSCSPCFCWPDCSRTGCGADRPCRGRRRGQVGSYDCPTTAGAGRGGAGARTGAVVLRLGGGARRCAPSGDCPGRAHLAHRRGPESGSRAEPSSRPRSTWPTGSDRRCSSAPPRCSVRWPPSRSCCGPAARRWRSRCGSSPGSPSPGCTRPGMKIVVSRGSPARGAPRSVS